MQPLRRNISIYIFISMKYTYFQNHLERMQMKEYKRKRKSGKHHIKSKLRESFRKSNETFKKFKFVHIKN